jgi:isopentenyl diphosphate isomerase/L-lactate dehydrogenase-like FMN-dependent dehydrogenase
MEMKCRNCRECNGIACRGEIPGLGGKGSGISFIRNVEAMKQVALNLDVCTAPGEVHTSCRLFGMDLAMPVFCAPVAGIRNNYGADLSEYDYACRMLDGCEAFGIRGFTGDGIDIPELFAKPAQAVSDHQGHGIVTIKPWVESGIRARAEVLKNMHYEMAAMDVDAAGLPLLRAGSTPVETKGVKQLQQVIAMLDHPFIVKGVMTVSAAQAAAAAGAAGIVVSNHGGRVLDDAPGTLTVLPEIAAAVKGKVTILIDGGIRTGNDIFKCLALGADGVLIGRPLALAAVQGGSEGLVAKLKQLQDQLQQAMLMTGCHEISDITADRVRILK